MLTMSMMMHCEKDYLKPKLKALVKENEHKTIKL